MEPAPARDKIHSCSNISNRDVEGQNVELDGVLGRGVAGTPITPLGRNCSSQNLPAVENGPMTSLATDMGKITNRFLSSAMEYEEKLAHLKEALDVKTAECQAWEETFNMSQKQHELTLSEYNQKLRKCLNEHALALSKQKKYEKLLESQKLDMTLKEQKEAVDTSLNEVKVSFESIITQCMDGLSCVEKARSLQRK